MKIYHVWIIGFHQLTQIKIVIRAMFFDKDRIACASEAFDLYFLWLRRVFINSTLILKRTIAVLWVKDTCSTFSFLQYEISHLFSSPLIDSHWTIICKLREVDIENILHIFLDNHFYLMAAIVIQMLQTVYLWLLLCIWYEATTWYCGMRREISHEIQSLSFVYDSAFSNTHF